jgi:hypothetical protein
MGNAGDRARFRRIAIMAELLSDIVIIRIGQATELFHKLVMLVAPAGLGKTGAHKVVHKRGMALFVNINLVLSQLILDPHLFQFKRWVE